MNFTKTFIAGLSYHLPEEIITSAEIEDRLAPLYQKFKLPFGRLELMTGIKERRFWPKGTLPSQLACEAGRNLLQKTSFPHREIELLINASVCRDFLEPATASAVHSHLDLSRNCTIFDLSNACLGVINGMVVAANMIEREEINSALIVSGENGGPLIFKTIDYLLSEKTLTKREFKKYIGSLTIGSAATAILLVGQNLAGRQNFPRMKSGVVATNSSAHGLCQGDGGINSSMMQTDSETLLEEGIKLATYNWQQFKEKTGWSLEEIEWVVCHQVGLAHENKMLQALEIEDKKTFSTYPNFGNTGSSALPLTWAKLLEQKTIPKAGDKMALLGIGSGLTSLFLGVEC